MPVRNNIIYSSEEESDGEGSESTSPTSPTSPTHASNASDTSTDDAPDADESVDDITSDIDGLSMHPKNIAKRAARWQTRLDIIKNGKGGELPKAVETDLARMRKEAEAQWLEWKALVRSRPGLQILLDYRFDRAQLPRIVLPDAFKDPATESFFLALADDPFASFDPHVDSGGVTLIPRSAKPERNIGYIYIRRHLSTAMKEGQLSTRLVAAHPQDDVSESVFALELNGKRGNCPAQRTYPGATVTKQRQKVHAIVGRHDEDMKTAIKASNKDASALSRVLNYYQLTEDEGWDLFELPSLRVALDPDRERFHLRTNETLAQYEAITIALLGPTTLNQAVGGEHPRHLGWAVPDELVAVQEETLARCRPDVPAGPDSVVDPPSSELAAIRSKVEACVRDEVATSRQLPRSQTGMVMVDSAVDQVVVNSTAFSLNKNGEVSSISLFKDETREGIEGQSTYWAEDSGRGPGYKKLVLLLALFLPAAAALPHEYLSFLVGWTFPAFFNFWSSFILHILYLICILWANRKLHHIDPYLVRIQSGQLERTWRFGHMVLPDLPAFCAFLEGTSCLAPVLQALASQLSYTVPVSTVYSTLAESGTSYIAKYGTDRHCIVLCEPDPGLISHDPSLRIFLLAVLFLIELKAIVFGYVIEKERRPRTVESLSAIRVEAEKLCDELGINALLAEAVARLCNTAFTLSACRMRGARVREDRAANAKGMPAVRALLDRRTAQQSRLVQIWNGGHPKARGEPGSQEREEQLLAYERQAKDSLLRNVSTVDIPCPVAMTVGDAEWRHWLRTRKTGKNLVRAAKATRPLTGPTIFAGETVAQAEARRVRVGLQLAANWEDAREAIAGVLARQTLNVRDPVTIFKHFLAGNRDYSPYNDLTTKSVISSCPYCELKWVGPMHSNTHNCSVAERHVGTAELSYTPIAFPGDIYYSPQVNVDLQLGLPSGTGSGHAFDFLPDIHYPARVRSYLDKPTTRDELGLIFWKPGMTGLLRWQHVSAVARLLAAPDLRVAADLYTLPPSDCQAIGFSYTSTAVENSADFISKLWKKQLKPGKVLYYNICGEQTTGDRPCAYITVRQTTGASHSRHNRQTRAENQEVLPRPAFPRNLTRLLCNIDQHTPCFGPIPTGTPLHDNNHRSILSAGTITSVWELPTPVRLRLAYASYESNPSECLKFLKGKLKKLLTETFPAS